MGTEKRSAQKLIRLRPSLKALAERAAADEDRSFSNLVEALLLAHLRARGDIKPERSQRRPRAK